MPVLVFKASTPRSGAAPGLATESGFVSGAIGDLTRHASSTDVHASNPPRSTHMIRAFDILVAFVAIVLFLPFILLIALLIKGFSSGPAIFCQRRIGRDGATFPCLKFRTMVVNSEAVLASLLEGSEEARCEWERDQKLRRDPRVTPIGEFLRKTSLDELPQLFNILAGQMSVVGPRPIVESEIIRYGTRFPAYCSVKPGLTGLWQVNGRNDVSYGFRVRLDALYAQRQSLSLNIAICVKTVPAILASRGCY